ncbi:MAG: dethiobiotin synthase [Leptospiraceae bacterium]|nr:dethiobiotin synthase [Leptospiraceae bacterium]
MKVFITGTGTNVGKTFLSALIMCKYGKKFKLKYSKPIQTGDIESNDKDFVQKYSALEDTSFHDTIYSFSTPVSPHLASELESRDIDIEFLKERISSLSSDTIVEGAGGLMVPIQRNFLTLNLLKDLNLPIILVGSTELGTINHSLLSIYVAKTEKLNLKGFYLIGKKEISSLDNSRVIFEQTNVPYLGSTYINEDLFTLEEFWNYAQNDFDKEEKIRGLLV